LSIVERDGKPLVHCHGGCEQRAVVDALKAQGLWPEREPEVTRRIVATYDYTDEAGELLYQVVRYEPKTFKQRYPDGAGGWTWKKHPRQILYHLREVLENPIVFLCEGERDCETLRDHGFVATTNSGGANAPWLNSYTDALRGRECILIPDRDRAGYERVKRIARALLGSVARLVYLELEDGKDVSEWFERGHSEVELIAQLDGEEVSQ
jgi:5S rRNA maturation endonuclease (ribonuclease M5)